MSGLPFEGPKALKLLLHGYAACPRAHGRESRARPTAEKSAETLARLHWRIATVRNNALHQLTHHLTQDWVGGDGKPERQRDDGQPKVGSRAWRCELGDSGGSSPKGSARGAGAVVQPVDIRQQSVFSVWSSAAGATALGPALDVSGVSGGARPRPECGQEHLAESLRTVTSRCGRWSLWSLQGADGRKLP